MAEAEPSGSGSRETDPTQWSPQGDPSGQMNRQRLDPHSDHSEPTVFETVLRSCEVQLPLNW